MTKNKTKILGLLLGTIALVNFKLAWAITDLPKENDPFWNVLNTMTSPNDAVNCQNNGSAVFVAQGLDKETANSLADQFCSEIATMDDQMQSAMNQMGVTTNLFSATNWNSVEGLYFLREGMGKVEFRNQVDFLSFGFLSFMTNFAKVFEMNQGEIGLDSNLVKELKSLGAVLTMYNVDDFNDPEILVDGKKDKMGIVSNLVYNRATRTIVFDAAHFTTFKAVEKSPTIERTSYRIYQNSKGEEILKVKIWGSGFEKKIKVYFGDVKAYRVEKKSFQEITARFKMSLIEKELAQKAKEKLRLAVKNPTAKEKIKSMDKKSIFKIKIKS